MANKRIIDLAAATTLSNQMMEIAGTDGVSHKTTFVDANTKVASVTGSAVNNTDPLNPIINLSGVQSVTGDGVDNTDPSNPIISSVQSVNSGIGITVDNTDPKNPIINSSSGVYHKSISSAEILSLFSTPIEVIPAAGANKVIIPKSWTTRYNFVSSGYSTETNVLISCLSIFWMPQVDILGNVANRFCIQFPSVNNQMLSSLAAFANQPFMISAQAANPTAGDSTLDIYIAYDIITI